MKASTTFKKKKKKKKENYNNFTTNAQYYHYDSLLLAIVSTEHMHWCTVFYDSLFLIYARVEVSGKFLCTKDQTTLLPTKVFPLEKKLKYPNFLKNNYFKALSYFETLCLFTWKNEAQMNFKYGLNSTVVFVFSMTCDFPSIFKFEFNLFAYSLFDKFFNYLILCSFFIFYFFKNTNIL